MIAASLYKGNLDLKGVTKIGLDKKGWDEFDFIRDLVKSGNYAALYLNYDDFPL